MANLKFKEISWESLPEKKGALMYVLFELGNGQVKWYPKWEHLADIINSSFATEGMMNNGRLKDFLSFILLEQVFRNMSVDKCTNLNSDDHHDLYHKYYKVVDAIRQNLLNSNNGDT